ncbi:MAG TPA: aldehyde dehydrogenase [Methanocorpusculum sp.]|nr:aldehyde dehydrogenase [Methanocorpusculum sp.]
MSHNTGMNIEEILISQRAFFKTGKTLSLDFRIEQLKKLYAAVKKYEAEIADALNEDLGKSTYESYMCETGLALSEISYMIKHTKRFSKEKRVKTPLAQFASRSYKKLSPYGNVLIMSPWNYPFMLTIDPLADAISAGNTAVVKPSAYSPATSRIVEKIVSECFEPEYVAVVTGGRAENTELLNQKFDMVFFTGSQNVGREVLRRTAENLTPAVLELGGKSPCIIDSSAKIRLAAKRIVFGKFLNCGQTCVAPDYILCDSSVKEELTASLIDEISKQFGERPLENPDYGHIISDKHFERLSGLIELGKVLAGGETDCVRRKIEPTLVSASFDDLVMQEEIFGPILPILTYDDFGDVISILSEKEKPLALYIFSENSAHINEVTERLSFGGGCVNDVVIHLATSEMGFGGVGESGMGCYHGKAGFDAFSHTKSIVDKKTWMDLPMRYQPYRGFYGKLLKIFLR